jgi:hypothetical protein
MMGMRARPMIAMRLTPSFLCARSPSATRRSRAVTRPVGGDHQRTIRAPSGHHQGTIRAPSGHHQSTTRAPSEHHHGTIRAPLEHHRNTNRAPTAVADVVAPGRAVRLKQAGDNDVDVRLHSTGGWGLLAPYAIRRAPYGICRIACHTHLSYRLPHAPATLTAHRMAYVVCRTDRTDRMGLIRWGNPLDMTVCRMAYVSYGV